jgi:hypothetical protein
MSQGEVGSGRVLADPQYGLVQVLRPFTKFEDAYNGLAGTVPVMFNEDGQILDERAGKAGYSPTLVNGLAVPFGARVQLWLPAATPNRRFGPYIWLIGWRFSNTYDYRTQRRSYHFPRQSAGVPDTTGGGSKPRVVLPAAWESVIALSSGPRVINKSPVLDLTASDWGISQLTAEGVKVVNNDLQFKATPTAMSPQPPLVAIGSVGVLQQGIFDPNDANTNDFGMPTFMAYDTRAKGDELLVACVKDQTPNDDTGWVPSWNLITNGDDYIFCRYFGQGGTTAGGVLKPPLSDVGVYVAIGVAP